MHLHPFLQLQLIHDAQVFEYLVKILPFVKPAEIMNAGIKDHPVPYISLQTATKLFVLFKHTYLIAFRLAGLHIPGRPCRCQL